MRISNLLLTFAALLLIATVFAGAQSSLVFVANAGTTTGNSAGITINAVKFQAQLGQIVQGNPLTAAYFRDDVTFQGDCYLLVTPDKKKGLDFVGTWDLPYVTWQKVFPGTTTYEITGTASGSNNGKPVSHIPVIIIVNDVVFDNNGFHN